MLLWFGRMERMGISRVTTQIYGANVDRNVTELDHSVHYIN